MSQTYPYSGRQPSNRNFLAILLIGLGLFWLLSQLNLIPDFRAGLAVVARFWPVILIALGVNLLIGRRSAAIGTLIGVVTVVVLALLFLVGPSLGLAPSFDIKTDRYEVPLEGAESASVRLNLSIGEVTVDALSDSSALMEADLRYLGDVQLAATGTSERVVELSNTNTPTQSGFNLLPFFDTTEENLSWTVGLNPSLPLALTVSGGVGTSSLNLSDLMLTRVEVSGGVGDLNLTLPDMGTRYPVNLSTGVGEIHVTLLDGAAVEMTIGGGVGNVTIDVPDDAPVRLETSTGLGDVDLTGDFNRISGDERSGVWVTDAYDGADVDAQITIHYDGGIGNLELR